MNTIPPKATPPPDPNDAALDALLADVNDDTEVAQLPLERSPPLPPVATDPSDRLAELGRRLLAAFPPNEHDSAATSQGELEALLERIGPSIAPAMASAVMPPGPVAATTRGTYRFPLVPELRRHNAYLTVQTNTKLHDLLRRLSFGKEPGTGRPLPYMEVRLWLCAINWVLNRRRREAPSLRPMRRPSAPIPGKPYGDDDATLSNDRQVIDLEWLWWSRPTRAKSRLAELLDTGDFCYTNSFNYALASRYVEIGGTALQKLADLRMQTNVMEQFFLGALCSDPVRKYREAVLGRAEVLRAVLLERASGSRSRLDDNGAESWVQEYIALRAARGSPQDAEEALRVLYDRHKPANQLSNRKQQLGELGFKTAVRVEVARKAA